MRKNEQSPIVKLKDLPRPILEHRSRNYRRRKCPVCNKGCYRDSKGRRLLHDLGDTRIGRPRDIEIIYSKHRCEKDKIYFNAPMTDLAPSGSCYTHKVQSVALRLIFEDGLPLRAVSWHLWRDHLVYVPFATVQNWVEGAGKKKYENS
jgi:hypothetical protein